MRRWIEISNRYPGWIVGLGLLLACGGAWFASGLKIRGDFAALLPSDFPSVQGFEEVTKQTGGQGFFILAIEGQDPDRVEAMTLTLQTRLRSLTTYLRSVQAHALDPFLQDRALYLLEDADLQEIQRRLLALRSQIRSTFRKAGPLSIDLDDPPSSRPSPTSKPSKPSVSFGDLLRKYNLSSDVLQGRGLITSKDRKTAVLLLQPLMVEGDIPLIRRMVAAVKAIVAEVQNNPTFQSLRVHYTGRYMVRMQEEDSINEQISTASVFSLIGVLLILLLYTRRKRSLLLIGLPLLCGIAWTAGIVAILTRNEINVMTAFIVALLFGLGIDLGIHFFMHYLQDRQDGAEVLSALESALSSTGHAGSIAVFTSAGAFFVIMFTDLKGFQQFGMSTGAGLLLTLLSFLFLMPALAILLERSAPLVSPPLPTLPPQKSGLVAQTREVAHAAHAAFVKTSGMIQAKASLALDRATARPLHSRLPWLGFTCGLLVMIAGATVLFHGKIKFNTDINSMITQTSSVITYNHLKKNVFGGETEPGLLLFSSWDALRSFQRRLTTELAEGKWQTIRYAYSVASFAPAQMASKQPLLSALRDTLESKVWRLIEEDDDYKDENRALAALLKMTKQPPYTEAELPQTLRDSLGGGQPLIYIVPKINPMVIRDSIRYAQEIRSLVSSLPPKTVTIGDSNIILSDMFVLLKRDGILSVLLAFGAILLVLFVGFFRRLSSLPLVLFPLLVGMAALLVGMWLFDLPLHPFNVMALPVSLGLGIDHNVYLLVRWRERNQGPIRESVRSIAPAIILAVLTSIVGFGSLIPLNHPGLRGLGVLTTLGILCGALAAFFLMPCLLALSRDRERRRPRSSPSSPAPSSASPSSASHLAPSHLSHK